MVKKIYSLNTINIPYSSQEIWPVILDVNSYSQWWPSSLNVKVIRISENLVGSQIEIRPYGGMSFYCEYLEKVQSTKLVMKYTGIYAGFGEWLLSEKNNQTEVSYEINLNITNSFIKAISILFPLDKIHHNLMNKVLVNLEKRIDEIKKRSN